MMGMEGDKPLLALGQNPGDPLDHLVINYAFASPLGGVPSPLPLTLPRAMFDAPAASLRSVIISNLESEEIIVKLRDIRFWKPRIALNCEVASNNWQLWLEEATIGGARPFEAITFTKSIRRSLKESVFDDNLVHIFVTSGEAPFYSPVAQTASEPPFCEDIVIGSYDIEADGRHVTEGERHSKNIKIPTSSNIALVSARTPTLVLGIRKLDVGSGGKEIQLLTHVSNIQPETFTAHFDSFGQTHLHQGGLSWMAIYPHSSSSTTTPAVQCGVVDSQSTHPSKLGRRSMTQRVRFRQSYDYPPLLFSCLSGLTIGGKASDHWDIRTFTTNISCDGFDLHIEKTRDSEEGLDGVVAQAQASWVAFPGSRTTSMGLVCGEFSLDDGARRAKGDKATSRVDWHGEVKFDKEFRSPPQVFAAFKAIDAAKSWNVRLSIEIEEVTCQGFRWKVFKWWDTVVHSAVVAFIAVGGCT